MPYPRETYFEPIAPYKKSWALAPQNRFLEVSGHKTRSMYDYMSSSIPFFYILMLSAIFLDIYLGFAILNKSGVNIILIALSVVADFFLAILPGVLAGYIDSLNPINLKNKLFKNNLECMTEKRNETQEEHEIRINSIKYGDIKKVKFNLKKYKVLEYITIILIICIATWKIYTYYAVLPPSMSIFSVTNGKIVILCSILCAVFHIIGSEKAFTHLTFFLKKEKLFNAFNEHNQGKRPEPIKQEIDYKGTYRAAKHENTELVVPDEGDPYLLYHHIIWDDEIQAIMLRQADESAKRGVVITCKDIQIF